MKTLLMKFFIEHWPRKCVALVLAVITWLIVNHTLTSTRNISGIPVRIVNLPEGKTVEGMHPNGKLAKKLTLTLVGNKSVIDELTPSDLEVVIDASDKPDEWIVILSKKNLLSLNPEIDLSTSISRMYHPNFIVRMTKMITDQIPIVITQPIGEAPRGYQFLDVWPYRLHLTVSGPEEVIKRLKSKEQRVTFNLTDISKAKLDELARKSETSTNSVISFFVPEQWKQIHIPILSDHPIEINDSQAQTLRIDFTRYNQLPVNSQIPIHLFFPPRTLHHINPQTISIASTPLIKWVNQIPFLNTRLFANGVDALFLETVRDRISIVVLLSSLSESAPLQWSVQFIDPRQLEDKYVFTILSNLTEQHGLPTQPAPREDYLRNRFRSYMHRFQLFESDEMKLELAPILKENQVYLDRVYHTD